MATGLTMKNAIAARDAILASQKQEIAQLYNKWADEIGERAQYYSHKTNASAPVSERYYKELQKQLTETSHIVSNEVHSTVKRNMYLVADAVVADNVKWLESFGFSSDGLNAAFSYVPDDVVQNLITGQIYESGWSLSQRIWGNNEEALKTLYQVVGRGVAEQRSAYDIARELEAYVRPGAKLPWNLTAADGKQIYRKQIDYNAQRLARTLVQHSYQQSFVATTINNPFVESYIWRSNGSRVCELCQERDGHVYQKSDLPLDHPNGMCTMEPYVDDEQMKKQLADWILADDGEYPEIDQFAKSFGYVPGTSSLTATQKKWLTAAGYTNGQMPKDFTEFAHKLTYKQQSELLEAAGGDWSASHPFQMMEKYYNANIAVAGGQTSVKAAVGQVTGVESLGTSGGKTFNYWYTKLNPEQKELAKKLKDESGLTWQQWYEKNIFTGKSTGKSVGKGVSKSGSVSNAVAKETQEFEEQYLKAYGWSADDIPTYEEWIAKLELYDADVEIVYQQAGVNLIDISDDAAESILKGFYTKHVGLLKTAKAGTGSSIAGSSATYKTTRSVTNMSKSKIQAAFRSQPESEMLSMEARAMAKMSNEQMAGLTRYTGGSYDKINAFYRKRARGEAAYLSDELKKAASNAEAGLRTATLERDLIVRRGTDLGDLAGFMPGDFNANWRTLEGLSVNELNARFAGTVGEYAGFTSASSQWNRGFFGDVEVVLNVPQGAQASSIMSISQYGTGEGETLLAPGTTVKIDRVEASDGHMGSSIRVFMDVIGVVVH